MRRKIDAMHDQYGVDTQHMCMDCCNYLSGNGGAFRKCAAYGETMSAATDWRASYIACGLFGQAFDRQHAKPLAERLKGFRHASDMAEGQIRMEGME